jgi:hypothetical protein
LESPPPYDAALQQPMIQQQQQQQHHQHQLNNRDDHMTGSNTRLISANNTPTQPSKSMSINLNSNYNSNSNNLLSNTPMSTSLQQIHFQQQQQPTNLQYTTVTLGDNNNKARSRNPLNGQHESPQHQHQQYTTMAQLSANPIDV